MKNVLVIITCFLFFDAYGQDNKENFDGKKWEAPYTLDVPKGWDVERFLIPIQFAPTISYKGVEDIRFTPGWGKKENDEYWSYAFLWYLDGSPEFDAKIIEKNLVAYYTGLFNINTDKSKIDTIRLAPVTAAIESKPPANGDLKAFQGRVTMNDYMTKKPITVNLVIHVKNCKEQNKTFVFYEVSPKPYSDNVWNSLHQLWINFRCTKK
jgi:hypothetical protein